MSVSHQSRHVSFERYDARQKIHSALRRLNWTEGQLAARAGLALGTVRNIASGTNATATGRAKVEEALGERIWTAADAPDALTTTTTNEDQTPPTS
ncbi:MAG: hypothetical protein P4L99_04930 [Chthoniobacter sp.]|nr:hypothetical protein [Chthoniobacter sp.]